MNPLPPPPLGPGSGVLTEHAPTTSLFDLQAQCLVNPVNTRGVMGAGLAKAFADRFPAILKQYQQVCRQKGLEPGGVWWAELPPSDSGPRWIAHMATKDDWRAPSRLGWVEAGLVQLGAGIRARGLTSIAVPALGCGLGGLNWNDVRPLLERHLSGLEGVDVRIIPPSALPPRFRSRP